MYCTGLHVQLCNLVTDVMFHIIFPTEREGAAPNCFKCGYFLSKVSGGNITPTTCACHQNQEVKI